MRRSRVRLDMYVHGGELRATQRQPVSSGLGRGQALGLVQHGWTSLPPIHIHNDSLSPSLSIYVRPVDWGYFSC